MNVKFISADGLTLESSVPDYPHLPVIRRPLMNKRLITESVPISVDTVIQTRDYDFTGIRYNVAIYEEMI